MSRFLADLSPRWSGRRVLVIGHIATLWGLEISLLGTPLEDLVRREFTWRAGWEYLSRRSTRCRQPWP